MISQVKIFDKNVSLQLFIQFNILDNVSNGVIFNNSCSKNSRGIRLSYQSNNNTVLGNNASNNYNAGIYLKSNSDNNTILENLCEFNGLAIYLWSGCDNNIIT